MVCPYYHPINRNEQRQALENRILDLEVEASDLHQQATQLLTQTQPLLVALNANQQLRLELLNELERLLTAEEQQ